VIVIAHIGSLQYANYQLAVRFYGLKEFSTKFGIRDITFHVRLFCLLYSANVSLVAVQKLQPIVHETRTGVSVSFCHHHMCRHRKDSIQRKQRRDIHSDSLDCLFSSSATIPDFSLGARAERTGLTSSIAALLQQSVNAVVVHFNRCFSVLDPLFPMIFVSTSWFPVLAEGLFQATFLCALLLFWLCVYHGIRQVKTATVVERNVYFAE
jgi:hypothetical protein